ncbi:MAG TPA: hypothetical protein VJ875_26260 [Pyrinomonadaceae bacterium]|nr:hypothetical protein [Pyrinomonadaceae bacterium]
MKSFGKQPSCPTSNEILSYVDGSISPVIRQTVERHAHLCDFCGAEMQLFARYKPGKEHYLRTPTSATVLGMNLQAVPAARVLRARAA